MDDAPERCPRDGTALETTLPGPVLLDGKYRLDRRLGQGGMGVVYEAEHSVLRRAFAIKLIRPGADASSLARFRVEAEALGRLKHPHVVDVADFGVDPRGGGVPYLVLEHLQGASLQSWCDAAAPPSIADAVAVLAAVASGVDFAHEHGILHRDLKPSNVFLADDGRGASVAKVLDFGIARLAAVPTRAAGVATPAAAPFVDVTSEGGATTTVDFGGADDRTDGERLTRAGAVVGTVAYLPPELLHGVEASTRSDVYSFGAMAYEVLCGRRPYVGSVKEVIEGHLTGTPPSPSSLRSDLPPECDEALLAALAKDPAARPRSCGEAVRRLQAALFAARERTFRAREVPRRWVSAAAIALGLTLLAPVLARLGALDAADRRGFDLLWRARPLHAPDPRLALLLIDEDTLRADPTPLAGRGDEFGRGLERVLDAGARAVALDLLPPAPWGESEGFAGMVMRRAGALTLAATQGDRGNVVGPEAVGGFATAVLGPQAARALFGLVNMDEDPDGISRRVRVGYAATDGTEQPTWATHAAATLLGGAAAPRPRALEWTLVPVHERFPVDYAADVSSIPRLSWTALATPGALERLRDRLVLVGDTSVASGDTHLVLSRGKPHRAAGIEFEAMVVDTVLGGFAIREVRPGLALALLAPLWALSAGVLLVVRAPLAAAGAWLLITVGYAVAVVALFASTGIVLPLGGAMMGFAVAGACAAGLRRRLPPFPRLEVP